MYLNRVSWEILRVDIISLRIRGLVQYKTYNHSSMVHMAADIFSFHYLLTKHSSIHETFSKHHNFFDSHP